MSLASTSRWGWVLLPYGERRTRAHVKRAQTICWLRKKGKSPEALALATKLEACRPMARC